MGFFDRIFRKKAQSTATAGTPAATSGATVPRVGHERLSPDADATIRSMEDEARSFEIKFVEVAPHLKDRATKLRAAGPAGSDALAGLISRLVRCRSSCTLRALCIAETMEPTSMLLSAVREAADAPDRLAAAAGEFYPQMQGQRKIGWSGPTARSIKEQARTAGQALVQLRAGEDRPELRRMLGDSWDVVRRVAASTLGNLRDAEAIEPLNTLLRNEPDVDVRAAAKVALEKIGGDAALRAAALEDQRQAELKRLAKFEAVETRNVQEAVDVFVGQALPCLPLITIENIQRICREKARYDIARGQRHVTGSAESLRPILRKNLERAPHQLHPGQRIRNFEVRLWPELQCAVLSMIIEASPPYQFGARAWRTADGVFLLGWEGFLASPR